MFNKKVVPLASCLPGDVLPPETLCSLDAASLVLETMCSGHSGKELGVTHCARRTACCLPEGPRSDMTVTSQRTLSESQGRMCRRPLNLSPATLQVRITALPLLAMGNLGLGKARRHPWYHPPASTGLSSGGPKSGSLTYTLPGRVRMLFHWQSDLVPSWGHQGAPEAPARPPRLPLPAAGPVTREPCSRFDSKSVDFESEWGPSRWAGLGQVTPSEDLKNGPFCGRRNEKPLRARSWGSPAGM